MEFRPLEIPGAFEIFPAIRRDERGSFQRTFDGEAFASAGITLTWLLDYQSSNIRRGTFRGFHLQLPPFSESKLVRAVVGSALDLFIDLRRNSPTFLRMAQVELDGDRGNLALVPKGCAHAYLALTDGCIVAYKSDAPYAPQAERGICWNDPIAAPHLGIDTPLIVSPKDGGWPLFTPDCDLVVDLPVPG